MTGLIPGNIVEEFQYILDAYEASGDVPDSLTYAVIRGLATYHQTGDAEQAVKVKEAFRIAGVLQKHNYTGLENLMEQAGEEFAAGNTTKAESICQDVAEQINQPINTEKAAIEALT